MSQNLSERMERVTWGLLWSECTIWREDAFFFSGSGNFNSIWQLLGCQDNPVTVSGYGQGWGTGAPEATRWWLCWNWVEMLSCWQRERKWALKAGTCDPVTLAHLRTEPGWVWWKRKREKGKREWRKWVLGTQKQLVHSDFYFSSGRLAGSLIPSQGTLRGAINSLFYLLKMCHQSNHFSSRKTTLSASLCGVCKVW